MKVTDALNLSLPVRVRVALAKPVRRSGILTAPGPPEALVGLIGGFERAPFLASLRVKAMTLTVPAEASVRLSFAFFTLPMVKALEGFEAEPICTGALVCVLEPAWFAAVTRQL